MRKPLMVILAAAAAVAVCSAPAAADEYGHDHGYGHDRDYGRGPGPGGDHWRGDIGHFGEHDLARWRGGQWWHGMHGGRPGWWWIVGGMWYFYPAPVYPFPNPYLPPMVAPPPPGQVVYYYCGNPPGYYPYVPACPMPWQMVPAAAPMPPPPPVYAPPPAPMPPPAPTGEAAPGNKSTIGTVLGAVGGGVAGAQFGHGSGKLAATAAGTLLGALIGHEVGASLDRADQVQAQQAEQAAYAAPIGQSVTWNNPDSGHSGTITPLRDGHDATGNYCREFQQSIVIDGKAQQGVGTACRQPDGSWKVVPQ